MGSSPTIPVLPKELLVGKSLGLQLKKLRFLEIAERVFPHLVDLLEIEKLKDVCIRRERLVSEMREENKKQVT